MKAKHNKYNTKSISPNNTTPDVVKVDKQQDIQLIFDNLNLKIEQKFSDKSFDSEKLKIELFSGKVISEKEIIDRRVFLLNNVAIYEKMFPQEFYDNIFRLNGWKFNKNKSLRPSVVGKFTNFCIYSRFDRNILPQLQSINPYIEFGIRRFKHFQWLNEAGRELLLIYIQQSIDLMKKCTNWFEFVDKYGLKYNLPTQSRLEFN